MPSLTRIDWAQSSASERLEALRTATGRQVCAMARAVEWERDTYEVIGWMSAQVCIDLGSALTLFMNAEPHRFNKIPRDDVPGDLVSMCAQLDALCQRINAGFYLPDPARQMTGPERLQAWMTAQVEDQARGDTGRWLLSPAVVSPMLGKPRSRARHRGRGRNESLISRLIKPLLA